MTSRITHADAGPAAAVPGFQAPRPRTSPEVDLPGVAPSAALRPDALPTDTFVRFLLLVVSVVAAGLSLFGTLWVHLRGDRLVAAWRECGLGPGSLGEDLLQAGTAALQQQAACRAPVDLEQTGAALAGTGLVLGAAWVAYRTWPRLQERRGRLDPLDPVDGEPVLREVQSLAGEAGLDDAPEVRVDAANPGVQAHVCGAGRRMRLALTGGLVVQQVLDPPAFRAVVRHELAHLANRDVPWTRLTVTTWWSMALLAFVPVAVVVGTSDRGYAAALGLRVAVLGVFVTLVVASVLRAREVYADARAATHGRDDLDRVLAAQPATSPRRPELLRLHPSPTLRRALLRDPGRLFSADAATAAAAGLATGLAVPPVEALLMLLLDTGVIAAAAALMAPLLAYVLCVVAWRVALREAVDGTRQRCALPLGLGTGAGFAVAPLLTLQGAVSPVAGSASGWAGYAVWVVLVVLTFLAVARWTADLARVAVVRALELESPRRVLAAHVAVTAVLVLVLLVTVQHALLFLTTAGPVLLLLLPAWLLLPIAGLADWHQPVLPLVVLALLAAALQARRREAGRREQAPGRQEPVWAWQESPGAPPAPPPALRGGSPPPLLPLVRVGVASGAAVALVMVGTRLLLPHLNPEARGTDAMSLALGAAALASLIVSGVVAALVSARLAPGPWWPLTLLPAVVAVLVTAVLLVGVVVATDCGLLPVLETRCAPPDLGVLRLALIDPAPLAAVAVLTAASGIGLLRGRAAAPAPGARPATRRGYLPALLAAGLVGLASTALHSPAVRVEPAVVETPAFTVTPPALWSGDVDPASGVATFVLISQDMRVLVAPVAEPSPVVDGPALVVGGRAAEPVRFRADQGTEQREYQVEAPDGSLLRVSVLGVSEALQRKQGDLEGLLASLSWRGAGG